MRVGNYCRLFAGLWGVNWKSFSILWWLLLFYWIPRILVIYCKGKGFAGALVKLFWEFWKSKNDRRDKHEGIKFKNLQKQCPNQERKRYKIHETNPCNTYMLSKHKRQIERQKLFKQTNRIRRRSLSFCNTGHWENLIESSNWP